MSNFAMATICAADGTSPETRDVVSSLAKGAAFGLIAAMMGCYYGMDSGRGAQGVGRATKGSVEAAAILILAANFVLTGVFFSI